MNKCKICQKETKNKVYCSIKCQHIGYKEIKVNRVKENCLYCKNEFETLPNKLENGKKYCSRICKDSHQKELYLKEGNPVFNIKHSDEWKEHHSIRMKKIWRNDEHKEKVKIGHEKFFNDNGFWMGTDEESCLKKNETNLDKYGAECILSVKEFREIANNTCLLKYGKTSFQLMREGLKKTKGTNIEIKISNILIENKIKFQTQYDVYYGNKFKTYDFYLIELNLLIEADGDYWHVNPIKYNELSILTEIQIKNKENDEFKNKLALEKGYNLERFWEMEIKKKNFKFLLANVIKKYKKYD